MAKRESKSILILFALSLGLIAFLLCLAYRLKHPVYELYIARASCSTHPSSKTPHRMLHFDVRLSTRWGKKPEWWGRENTIVLDDVRVFSDGQEIVPIAIYWPKGTNIGGFDLEGKKVRIFTQSADMYLTDKDAYSVDYSNVFSCEHDFNRGEVEATVSVVSKNAKPSAAPYLRLKLRERLPKLECPHDACLLK